MDQAPLTSSKTAGAGADSQAPPSLEARLQTLLERVVDWLKYEEAKNGVLITLNGVAAGLFVQWSGSTQGWLAYVYKVCGLAFLISLLIGLRSVYPVTDTTAVHEDAAEKRRCENDEKEKKKKKKNKGAVIWLWAIGDGRFNAFWQQKKHQEPERLEPNVLFFADIAGLEYDDYLATFRSATTERAGEKATQLEKDYAREIIANAELTLLKIGDFKMALAITFTALAVACLAGLGDQLVRILMILWSYLTTWLKGS